MRIVLVANDKGGCGKTTIATTLAAAAARGGARVALADAAPQRAALSWLGRRACVGARPDAEAPGLAPLRPMPAISALDWTRGARLGSLDDGALDLLVVDTAPGGLDPDLAAAADVVLAPFSVSLFDGQATLRFLALIEAQLQARGGRAALFAVANGLRKRRGPRGAIAPKILCALEDGGAELIGELSDHALYPVLAEGGLSVFDARGPKPARLQGQWSPLLTRLRVAPPPRPRAPRSGPLGRPMTGALAPSVAPRTAPAP